MARDATRLTGDAVQRAAQRLRRAHSVVALTGAGISAESGIPTFREAQTGLWARYDAADLATPEAFARDPQFVWRWYAWRRSLVLQAQPNPGHVALAELEALLPAFTLVTQNVDGLHQRAGSHSVIEFHGNILRTLCSREHSEFEVDDPADERLPHCPSCGAAGRPGVVWFGELIPPDALQFATGAAETCDVLLSIGTSSLVYPAAGLAEAALRAGAFVIEINPAHTPLTRLADAVLRGPAGEMLPALLAAWSGHEHRGHTDADD